MKLSEAILAGCVLSPDQAFDDYFLKVEGKEAFASCALGAAAIGGMGLTTAYIEKNYLDEVTLKVKFPVLLDWMRPCPVKLEDPERPCDFHKRHAVKGFHTLYGLIIHLNDIHRWTREAIATHIKEHYENEEATAPNGVGSHTVD